MTVGTVLKQAREQAGLSTEQVSERTKIQLYKIEALEEDDFSRLPEGIYLDGIIRAYSREVGINSEAMVARARIERGKRPGDWEVPFSAPIDLRGVSRSERSSAHRGSRFRRSVGFIRDRAPNVGCAGGATRSTNRRTLVVGRSADRRAAPGGATGSGDRANAGVPST